MKQLNLSNIRCWSCCCFHRRCRQRQVCKQVWYLLEANHAWKCFILSL